MTANRNSDRDLLTQYVGLGSQSAFDEIVQRHGNMVAAIARKGALDQSEAEEVFQRTFETLTRCANKIAWSDSIAGWLCKVAYRNTIRASKKRRGLREVSLEDDIAVNVSELARILEHERKIAVFEELSKLPERYRGPLVLCYLEGKDRTQAALELNCSEGVIKGRLARGKILLRKQLTRRGITSPGILIASSGSNKFASNQLSRSDFGGQFNHRSSANQIWTVRQLPNHLSNLFLTGLDALRPLASPLAIVAVVILVSVLSSASARNDQAKPVLFATMPLIDEGPATRASIVSFDEEQRAANEQKSDSPPEKSELQNRVSRLQQYFDRKAPGEHAVTQKPGNAFEISQKNEDGGGVDYPSHRLIPGDTAPEINPLRWLSPSGETTPPDLTDKVVLLYLAANKSETDSDIEELYQQYRDKGLVVIGLRSTQPDLQPTNFPFPTAINDPVSSSPKNVSGQFGLWGSPTTVLIDRGGVVREICFNVSQTFARQIKNPMYIANDELADRVAELLSRRNDK